MLKGGAHRDIALFEIPVDKDALQVQAAPQQYKLRTHVPVVKITKLFNSDIRHGQARECVTREAFT